jgi:uncharacterized protein (TIGR02145 family)
MKSILTIIFFTALTIKLSAQDITVSFKSNDVNVVIDSVQATNLNTNETITISGSKTLTLDSSVNAASGVFKSTATGKTLHYSTGNNIMFTLYSGSNIRVMVDKPYDSKTYNVAFYKCADKDGRNYKTITIGSQTWMAENLAYLPSITSAETSSSTEPCYYVYDYEGTKVSEAKTTDGYADYGVLYNWTAAMNICPSIDGWHLPSIAEWITLKDYLKNNGYGFNGKGSNIVKSLASTSGWNNSSASGSPGNDTLSNNRSGFSALPGGDYLDGDFDLAGECGYWWLSTVDENNYAWTLYLHYESSGWMRLSHQKNAGFSVRCIKD